MTTETSSAEAPRKWTYRPEIEGPPFIPRAIMQCAIPARAYWLDAASPRVA